MAKFKERLRALHSRKAVFFGAIKVGKALSTIIIFILSIRNHFRKRLGKAVFSSTVNDPTANRQQSKIRN